jgi:hypothetical protein
MGLRSCHLLLDDIDQYDLINVSESLNEGILDNNPDLVNTKANDLSKILDEIWEDKTIPKRIDGLNIGARATSD